MLSAFDNTDQPPMMSPESESPSWYRIAQANRSQAMGDPKQRMMMALLAQQLGQSGQGLAGGPPALMQKRQMNVPGFDIYGNMP